MYDRKVVRRRRAALAVFVALSIAILTAYFGESSGGLFHTFQRGAQEAFAPVETGASRALKPPRTLGDKLHEFVRGKFYELWDGLQTEPTER